MKTLAIYVRVSGKSQDTASQEPDLKRWAQTCSDVVEGKVVVKWYRDKFTGKTMDRPGWNALAADVAAGKVSTVVCWRIDRLGRTAKGLTALFEDLNDKGVNLVSLKDGLDLSTPAGRLMANVLASVAQFETEVRRERVVAGLAIAKDKGTKLGRPTVGKGKGTRISVTTEQADLVKRLKDEGQKVAAIARATKLSRPTVYSILAS